MSIAESTARLSYGLPPLPYDILPHVLHYADLKTLLQGRGVNHTWKSCISSASIIPARRGLYDLYLRLVSPETENFLESRAYTIEALHYFDRAKYLDKVEGLGCVLPDDFRMWVLEWPEKAVFGWTWPGLYSKFVHSYECPPGRHYGANLLSWAGLGNISPITGIWWERDVNEDSEIEPRYLDRVALVFWDHGSDTATWIDVDLMAEKNGACSRGEVFFMRGRGGKLDDKALATVASSWTNYLMQLAEGRNGSEIFDP